MIKQTIALDAWVFEHIGEPLAWLAESRLGLSKYWQARILTFLYYVAAITSIHWQFKGSILRTVLVTGFCYVLYSVTTKLEAMKDKDAMALAREHPFLRGARFAVWAIFLITVLLLIVAFFALQMVHLMPGEEAEEIWKEMPDTPMTIVFGIFGSLLLLQFFFSLGARPKPPERETQLAPQKA